MAINPYRNTRKYDKFKRKSCIYFVSEKFSTLLLINLNISRANISINVKLTSMSHESRRQMVDKRINGRS